MVFLQNKTCNLKEDPQDFGKDTRGLVLLITSCVSSDELFNQLCVPFPYL